MATFPKLTYRFNAIPTRMLADFFNDKLILKFRWNCKEPEYAKQS